MIFFALVAGLAVVIGVRVAFDNGRSGPAVIGALVGGGGVALLVVAYFVGEAVRRSDGGLESIGQGFIGAMALFAGLALALIAMVVLFWGGARSRQDSLQPASAPSVRDGAEGTSGWRDRACASCGRSHSGRARRCLFCGADR